MSDRTQLTFQRFKQEYQEQHPASVPVMEDVMKEYPDWIIWATLAMFVCAAMLSGVHTVPTAYATIEAVKVAEYIRQPVSLGTFVFIEVGILVTSFLLFKKWSWLAFGVLVFCLMIAMAANLYSVSKAIQSQDAGSIIVGALLGIGAPLIAMMSGKMYVNIHRAHVIAVKQAQLKYREDCKVYDNMIILEWKEYREQAREEIRVERERTNSLNSVNEQPEQPRLPYSANSSGGYNKRMDARSVIYEFFQQNPNTVNSKLDELVRRIESETGVKVGRTSVHNVRNEILAASQRTGGGESEAGDGRQTSE